MQSMVFPHYNGEFKNQNKNAHSHRIGRNTHYPPLVSIVPGSITARANVLGSRHRRRQAQGEPQLFWYYILCFCFGISRVLNRSRWYADKWVAQLNGCASSTSQAYTHMHWRRTNTSQLPCTHKISTLLGGPFHSGAPRLCLPCLPYRDATDSQASSCHCRQRTWLPISTWSVFTFRCHCVRQQTSCVL